MLQSNYKNRLLASSSLFLTSIIWGGGFIFTAMALDSGMHPIVVIALRFLIPSVFMLLFFFKKLSSISFFELRSGIISGVLVFAGFLSQTYGISLTTPANNAFITATNVIMVPYISWVLSKAYPGIRSFILTLTCFAGTIILSWSPEFGLNFNAGDWLTLLCAFLFACHISYLSVITKKLKSVVMLNFIQLLSVGILSVLTILIFDISTDFSLKTGLTSVIYLGVLATGLCYFLQTWAQCHVSPSRAAIILSCEGLFGSLFSVLLGYDKFTSNLLFGGLIILISIILIQVDLSELLKPKNKQQ